MKNKLINFSKNIFKGIRLGIKHRDIVEYTYKNGEIHRGYVTALYPHLNALNFQSLTKHCKKVNAKKCRLIYKFNNVYWF